MNRSLSCVDGLIVGYLLLTGLLFLPGCLESWVYRGGVALHLGLAAAVVRFCRGEARSVLGRRLREIYPIFLLLLFYVEVDLLVKAVHDPPGYDGLVRVWDEALFGSHLHATLPQGLNGRLWREGFHLLYLSYYLLLVGSFVGVWTRAPSRLPRFTFVVTGVFVSFMLLFVAFPVAGPLTEPGVAPMTEGWFPQVVAWIYVPLRANGIATGAFPSSHVGVSVGIACLLAPQRWTGRLVLWGLVLGIAASTVYGRFHYAIDAVAGLVAGGGLYVIWSALYAAVARREVPFTTSSERGEAAAEASRPF